MLNVFDVNYYEYLNRGFRNTAEQGLIYVRGRNITFYMKYEFLSMLDAGVSLPPRAGFQYWFNNMVT